MLLGKKSMNTFMVIVQTQILVGKVSLIGCAHGGAKYDDVDNCG